MRALGHLSQKHAQPQLAQMLEKNDPDGQTSLGISAFPPDKGVNNPG
jgi:hypothetical protein